MSVQPTAAVLLLVCSLLMIMAIAERNPTTAVEKNQGRLDVPEGVLPSDRISPSSSASESGEDGAEHFVKTLLAQYFSTILTDFPRLSSLLRLFSGTRIHNRTVPTEDDTRSLYDKPSPFEIDESLGRFQGQDSSKHRIGRFPGQDSSKHKIGRFQRQDSSNHGIGRFQGQDSSNHGIGRFQGQDSSNHGIDRFQGQDSSKHRIGRFQGQDRIISGSNSANAFVRRNDRGNKTTRTAASRLRYLQSFAALHRSHGAVRGSVERRFNPKHHNLAPSNASSVLVNQLPAAMPRAVAQKTKPTRVKREGNENRLGGGSGGGGGGGGGGRQTEPDPTRPPPEWGKKSEILQCIDCYQDAFNKVFNSPPFYNYATLKVALTQAESLPQFRRLQSMIMACVKKGLSYTFSRHKRSVGHTSPTADRRLSPAIHEASVFFGLISLSGSRHSEGGNEALAGYETGNDVRAQNEMKNDVLAQNEMKNDVLAQTEIENYVRAQTELENALRAYNKIENAVWAQNEIENKVQSEIGIQNKFQTENEVAKDVWKEDEIENDLWAENEIETSDMAENEAENDVQEADDSENDLWENNEIETDDLAENEAENDVQEEDDIENDLWAENEIETDSLIENEIENDALGAENEIERELLGRYSAGSLGAYSQQQQQQTDPNSGHRWAGPGNKATQLPTTLLPLLVHDTLTVQTSDLHPQQNIYFLAGAGTTSTDVLDSPQPDGRAYKNSRTTGKTPSARLASHGAHRPRHRPYTPAPVGRWFAPMEDGGGRGDGAVNSPVRSEVRDIFGGGPVVDFDDLRRRFLQWKQEVKNGEAERDSVSGTRHRRAAEEKWVVLDNKNSIHILRNLRQKVEHKTKPWGVFKVLDVCAAKRKIKPLKPPKSTTATTQTTKRRSPNPRTTPTTPTTSTTTATTTSTTTPTSTTSRTTPTTTTSKTTPTTPTTTTSKTTPTTPTTTTSKTTPTTPTTTTSKTTPTTPTTTTSKTTPTTPTTTTSKTTPTTPTTTTSKTTPTTPTTTTSKTTPTTTTSRTTPTTATTTKTTTTATTSTTTKTPKTTPAPGNTKSASVTLDIQILAKSSSASESSTTSSQSPGADIRARTGDISSEPPLQVNVVILSGHCLLAHILRQLLT